MTLQATLIARRRDFVAFVERRVRSRSLAEDLVQAAFEHAIAHLDDVRDEAAVVAWFYRSLRNAVIDRQRRGATEQRGLEAFAKEMDQHIVPMELTAPRVCRCVLRVAEDLKSEYAGALRAIEVDGIAVKEFAEQQGISSSNAAVRVFRAREALRKGLAATCGACAAGGCADCSCDREAPKDKGCH